MRALLAVACAGVVLAACQTTPSPRGPAAAGYGVGVEEPSANSTSGQIYVLREHPADVKQLIEAASGLSFEEVAQVLEALSVETVNTNYDELKSVVVVAKGPVNSGTRLRLQYRYSQFEGWQSQDNEISKSLSTDPVVFVNSFRVSRPADMTVRALLGDKKVADASFSARGPAHDFGKDWNEREDYVLTVPELRELFVGSQFVVDEFGARLVYGNDGNYRYIGNTTYSGKYRFEPEGFVCASFERIQPRCDRIVVNSEGHLYLVNKASRRYRLTRED